MGLPSLPFMEGQGDLALAKGEIGFLKFVAVPWWAGCICRARALAMPVRHSPAMRAWVGQV